MDEEAKRKKKKKEKEKKRDSHIRDDEMIPVRENQTGTVNPIPHHQKHHNERRVDVASGDSS